jgi:hypothetical protein
MKLSTAYKALRRVQALRYLTLNQTSTFVRLAARLKRDILQPQPIPETIPDTPPTVLPPSVAEFLSDALALPIQDINLCWDLLKEDVWEAPVLKDIKQEDLRLFKEYGRKRGLGSSYISSYHDYTWRGRCIRCIR